MADNSYRIVTAYNVGSSAVLDGFTITNGNAGGDVGAGFYIEDASPALRNLLVANNQAFRGGGMFITSNTSLASSPSLSDVGFAGNSASIGGGIFSQNSAPLLSRVVFSGNSATAGAGGGMNVQTISDLDPPVYTSLTDVIFKNNTATGGGGLFLGNTSSATTITNATFDGNVANRRGGAMLFEYSSPTLTNVTVANNISNDNLASPKGGGGIMNIDSSPTLIHVTFSGNNSLLTGGDAMRNAAGLDLTGSFPLIRNSILWDSDDEITTEDLGGATISDSILKGGCPAGSTCSNVTGADPLLGLLANNGGFGETLAMGLGSPANNSASLASCTPFDQRGVSRPQGSGCDLGAFELVETGLPTPTPTNTPLPPTATPTSTPLPPTATPTSTSVPPTATPTHTPTPATILYLSSNSNGTAGGVAFSDEDILSYNTQTSTWTMYFDGSDVGITGDVDAFFRMQDGTILLSLDADGTVSGLGTVDDSDAIRFTPTSLGTNTAGSLSWYFDGSDVGLTTTAEDIDALGFTPDGRLVFSTIGSFAVTGASGNDEDLLAFTPASLGATTSGSWSLYFDGSDVDLNTADSGGDQRRLDQSSQQRHLPHHPWRILRAWGERQRLRYLYLQPRNAGCDYQLQLHFILDWRSQ